MKAFLLLMLTATALAQGEPGWFTPAAPVMPSPFVKAGAWGSQPDPMPTRMLQVPERIVIHHAGVVWKEGTDPYDKVRALQAWGKREKGWPDVPYHFLIAPDGRIFEGRPTNYRPESNTHYDLSGVLNVELFGDFEVQKVSEPQKEALRKLLVYLCREHNIGADRVSTHRLQAPGQTTCPGRDLMDYYSHTLMPRLRSEMTRYGRY